MNKDSKKEIMSIKEKFYKVDWVNGGYQLHRGKSKLLKTGGYHKGSPGNWQKQKYSTRLVCGAFQLYSQSTFRLTVR